MSNNTEKKNIEDNNKVNFDYEEFTANEKLISVVKTIMEEWHLEANHGELYHAVHTIQAFITQRMLHRLNPEAFNNWYR